MLLHKPLGLLDTECLRNDHLGFMAKRRCRRVPVAQRGHRDIAGDGLARVTPEGLFQADIEVIEGARFGTPREEFGDDRPVVPRVQDAVEYDVETRVKRSHRAGAQHTPARHPVFVLPPQDDPPEVVLLQDRYFVRARAG
jgi:hypothetical protein